VASSFSGKSMNAEHWKRIEEVYYSAFASPPVRRTALPDELCSNDPDMLREVESLLDGRQKAGSFLSPSHYRVTSCNCSPNRPGCGGGLKEVSTLDVAGYPLPLLWRVCTPDEPKALPNELGGYQS
jgi:hypothetical protein